jgi:SAM-dependent methyltransferase
VTTAQTPSTVLRNLLDPARLPGQTSDEHGFLDLVTDDGTDRRTIAQRAMENPALARIYEKVWRPAFTRKLADGADGTFDAACCLAALYLIPEQHQVIDEMIRVLKPGGTLAIFTSADVMLTRLPMVKPTLNRLAGFNVLGRDEIPSKLHRRGFTEISQRIAGQGQFVTARK